MAIFLLRGSADPKTRSAVESELLAAIPDLTDAPSFKWILEQTSGEGRGEPEIVLAVTSAVDQGHFDRMVEIAAEYRNDIYLILVSEEISASDYKRLVRTGGADWASAKGAPREVADIIGRRRQQLRSPGVPASRGDESRQPVTISFVPSAGGVGNTTLAVEFCDPFAKEQEIAAAPNLHDRPGFPDEFTFVTTLTANLGCISRNFQTPPNGSMTTYLKYLQLTMLAGSTCLQRRGRNFCSAISTSMRSTPSST